MNDVRYSLEDEKTQRRLLIVVFGVWLLLFLTEMTTGAAWASFAVDLYIAVALLVGGVVILWIYGSEQSTYAAASVFLILAGISGIYNALSRIDVVPPSVLMLLANTVCIFGALGLYIYERFFK